MTTPQSVTSAQLPLEFKAFEHIEQLFAKQ
jgi:hypothetical protein